MKEALFYKKLKKDIVQCQLCPRKCIILNEKRGNCGVRENKNGKLYSLVYGKLCSANVDNIEKKPFYHFLSGTTSYSIATPGCQLHCIFCQNWEISQAKPEEIPSRDFSPEEIVEKAITNKCKSISYTYTDPVVFYEYMLDTAKIAKKKGLKNVMVHNGYINSEPLKQISKFIDAANIDLKSFSEDFYKKVCGARLKFVLENIKKIHELKIWMEITTLVIPGKNDSSKELTEIAKFIAKIDKNIPWHVSAFYPMYKMLNVPSTKHEDLIRAYNIGKKYLNYVYVGNVLDSERESSYCPKCKTLLIKRQGYNTKIENLKKGKCGKCGELIKGVWE